MRGSSELRRRPLILLLKMTVQRCKKNGIIGFIKGMIMVFYQIYFGVPREFIQELNRSLYR